HTASALLRTEDAADRSCHASPLAGFGGQLLASGFGQRIKACPAVVVRRAPFGANPSTRFKALERRIQRAVIHEQRFFGLLLNGARDALAMLRTKQQRAQDQQVESALQEVD